MSFMCSDIININDTLNSSIYSHRFTGFSFPKVTINDKTLDKMIIDKIEEDSRKW